MFTTLTFARTILCKKQLFKVFKEMWNLLNPTVLEKHDHAIRRIKDKIKLSLTKRKVNKFLFTNTQDLSSKIKNLSNKEIQHTSYLIWHLFYLVAYNHYLIYTVSICLDVGASYLGLPMFWF